MCGDRLAQENTMRPDDFSAYPIMLVDDDTEALSLLKLLLRHDGFTNVVAFDDSQKALEYFEKEETSVIVMDLLMPKLHGGYLLEVFSREKPYIPVIIVSGESQIDLAIECMKTGAVDYLTKPLTVNRFTASIKRALELRSLNEDIMLLDKSADAVSRPLLPHTAAIITQNKEMFALLRYAEVVSKSRQPVLITGETGVGKELVAKSVHTMSGLKGGFVCINIAGLDDLMFSDTLFGHCKGAYTGAHSDRDGLIMKAAKGTIFLDEIGDLNEYSQIKLLRLLQENEYYPLGSDNAVNSHARLVVATNRNLRQRVNEGKFRKDLYYRLCTHQIAIPPLRNRQDDLSLLLEHFIQEAAHAMGKGRLSYRKELINLLKTYDFPGNVRELQSMVYDFVSRSTTTRLSATLFKQIIEREKGISQPLKEQTDGTDAVDFNSVFFATFPTIRHAEAVLISKALNIANGNQGIAAQLLGITRQALNNRLRRTKRPASLADR
jgi:DNA-binding NtrC family response regulator